MPKRILVRLKGVAVPEVVDADEIERDGAYLVLRAGKNIVAQFKADEVVGWIIHPE